MEIVCDTNIWYKIGQNLIDENVYKDHKLIGTFNSIDELSRSEQLRSNPEVVRNAIRSLITKPTMTFYEPPLIYLKRLNNPNFKYSVLTELKSILMGTQLIANGHELNEDKNEGYLQYCRDRKNGLKEAADFFNEKADIIKSNIKNKEKNRKENSIPLNRDFVSFLVASQTKTDGLNGNFNWSRIELFENVLKVLFNEMELGAIKLVQNDWYDLFNMLYVTPERLYWTEDEKWIRLIIKAGMEKYLFNPSGKEVS